MSVAVVDTGYTIGDLRILRTQFGWLARLVTKNEEGYQSKDDKCARDGQYNSHNIHAYNLGVWSLIFKRGVASC